MKWILRLILAVALVLPDSAGMPQLKSLRLGWPLYRDPAYGSGDGAAVYIYKATLLGTVYSPPKPTAVFPGGRTNGTIAILPGTYKLYMTVQFPLNDPNWPKPYIESPPSNVITITIPP